jgi:hypothetical protein
MTRKACESPRRIDSLDPGLRDSAGRAVEAFSNAGREQDTHEARRSGSRQGLAKPRKSTRGGFFLRESSMNEIGKYSAERIKFMIKMIKENIRSSKNTLFD